MLPTGYFFPKETLCRKKLKVFIGRKGMRLINPRAGCAVFAYGIEQYRTVSCICPPVWKSTSGKHPQASVNHPTNREIRFLEVEFDLGARFAGLWGCLLTKIFLLSDKNILTLPIDENDLKPCFLTKMQRIHILKLTLNIANLPTIIISLWVIWAKKIPCTVEKMFF